MTEAATLTVEQIKATLPKLSVDEFHEVSKAVAKDASRRIRTRKPKE